MTAARHISTESVSEKVSVLLVDDDDDVRDAHERCLIQAGYAVTSCSDGVEAVERIAKEAFDVVLSDISMPQMDGIELLRRVREHDSEVPVVLITGAASIETAIRAVDYDAFRYLQKPIGLQNLVSTVEQAAIHHKIARERRGDPYQSGIHRSGEQRAKLAANFEKALDKLWVAYQPIVRATSNEIFGYEALMRTDEPTLPNPEVLLNAAEQLGELQRLGRTVRKRVLAEMPNASPGWFVFLNVHPAELDDPELLDPASGVAKMADQVVLEITEHVALESVTGLSEKVKALRDAGYWLAIDDLGAGYSTLASFVSLEPDVVKLDISLVHNVDRSPVQQRLIRSIVSVCRETGMLLLAEGIETDEEMNCVIELGVDLLQGYRLGRPSLPFIDPLSR